MPSSPQLKESKAFQAQIWAFYGHSGRHNLPWRKTKDPYKILVSEVMLQQTQVSRVLEKYPEFLKKFPTVKTLAQASLAEVLRTWQGMGYNRRALALKRLAEVVVHEHGGKVPRSRTELEALPGVGPYTAGAVRAFAWNEPEVFIETNIRRIFIHHFFKDRAGVSDRDIAPLVAQTLDTMNPREWYWAVMDYGAYLPKVAHKNPNTQSKHYTKQSMFKGSLRELRGKVLRALGEKPRTLVALKRICNDDSRTKKALEGLVKDKLIKYEKRTYQLA